MNCYFHPELVSSASCVDCGKALCTACAEQHEISICGDCNLKRNNTDVDLAVKKFIPSLVMFVVCSVLGFFMISDSDISFPMKPIVILIIGWVGGGMIWGWFYTGKWFKPKVYIVAEGSAGFSMMRTISFIFRLLLSGIIGIYAMPASLVKLIISLKKAKKISQSENESQIYNEQLGGVPE